MPPANQQDNFKAAALRHQRDAEVLLEHGRPDGAIHLAGFAAECGLKAWLERDLRPPFVTHNLEQLSGRDLAWVMAAVASPRLTHWLGHLSNQPLSHKHPVRRYWASGWSAAEVEAGLDLSGRFLAEAVLGPLLDHHIALR